jgi:hypothetical protein
LLVKFLTNKIKNIIEKLQNKNYIFRFEVTYQKKNFC